MKKAIIGLTVLTGGLLLLSKLLTKNPICSKHEVSKIGVVDLNGRIVDYRCIQCEIEKSRRNLDGK